MSTFNPKQTLARMRIRPKADMTLVALQIVQALRFGAYQISVGR